MNGRRKVRILSSQQINLFISMCQKGGINIRMKSFEAFGKMSFIENQTFSLLFFRSSESFCSFWLFYIKSYLSSLTFSCELQFLVNFLSFMLLPSIQQLCEAKKVFLNDIRPSPQFFFCLFPCFSFLT